MYTEWQVGLSIHPGVVAIVGQAERPGSGLDHHKPPIRNRNIRAGKKEEIIRAHPPLPLTYWPDEEKDKNWLSVYKWALILFKCDVKLCHYGQLCNPFIKHESESEDLHWNSPCITDHSTAKTYLYLYKTCTTAGCIPTKGWFSSMFIIASYRKARNSFKRELTLQCIR